jgi:hypothetical protein
MEAIQLVPDTYNPATLQTQYAEISPNKTLPADKIYHAPRGLWTLDQIRAKGVNCISYGELSDLTDPQIVALRDTGVTYWDVPKTSEVMQLQDSGLNEWVEANPRYNKKYFPNGLPSESEGAAKGQIASTDHRMNVFETEENYDYLDRSSPAWKGFYSTYMPRMHQKWTVERGMKYYVAHSYLNLGWPDDYVLGQGTRAANMAMLSKTIDQMPFTEYSPGGNLNLCNLMVDAVYIGAPDDGRNKMADAAFKMLVFRQMGKYAATYVHGNHDWRPNNHGKTVYPDGRFYRQGGISLSPHELIWYGFVGQVHGHGGFQWGHQGKINNALFDPEYNQSDMFFANGSNVQSQMPHYRTPGSNLAKWYGYNGASDFMDFGVIAYQKTFAHTLGQNKQFCPYKLDGGAYKSGHLVDARWDFQGWVYTERSGNKLAWYFVNPYADNLERMLTFKDQYNVERSVPVAGAGLHCGLETI